MKNFKKVFIFRNSKGFTLIELLVVIAIIGILAAIVLAALNSANSKGGDAGVKSNLNSLRSRMELQFDSKGCYARSAATVDCVTTPVASSGACPTINGTKDTAFDQAIVVTILNAADAAGGLTSCSTPAGASSYAAVVQYKSNLKKAWCVDSTGKAKEVSHTNDYDQTSLDAEITDGKCVE